MPTRLSTLSLLALALPAFVSALPTPSPEPFPALAPDFDDVLRLSPREVEPAYLLAKRLEDYTAPKPLKNSIAYFPAITSPAEGSEWAAGGSLTVAWNNTKPNYAENQIHKYATLLLGYTDASSPGYHLDIDHPLANVTLYGSEDPIEVTLPADLPTRSSYILVLGSTANTSPLFTINAVGGDASSAGTSSTTSATKPDVAASSSSSSSPSPTPQGAARQAAPASSASSTSPAAKQSPAAETANDAQPASTTNTLSPVAAGKPSSTSAEVASAVATSASPAESSTSKTSSAPVTASGGALAAASAAPTSDASRLVHGFALFAAGLVASLVVM
ncbi:hypothetical protein JCM10212_004898 [Sporobolomyces blumeae]